jgi:hypothetical protein
LDGYFCDERIIDFLQRTGGYGDGTVAEASFEAALWVTSFEATAVTT